MANPTNPFYNNFSSRDDNFEPTVRILLGRIKGQYLVPLKIKYPSSTPVNKGGFHSLRGKKSKAKVWKKNQLLPPFFQPLSYFSPPLIAVTPSPSPLLCPHQPWPQNNYEPPAWPPPHVRSNHHELPSLLCKLLLLLPQLTSATISSINASWATGWTSSPWSRPPRQATFLPSSPSSSSLVIVACRIHLCMQRLIN